MSFNVNPKKYIKSKQPIFSYLIISLPDHDELLSISSTNYESSDNNP
jgi:hypothetical protein